MVEYAGSVRFFAFRANDGGCMNQTAPFGVARCSGLLEGFMAVALDAVPQGLKPRLFDVAFTRP